MVRVYNGGDPEWKGRKYLSQTIHGGLRDAQAHLNKLLGERDGGRNLDSSKQILKRPKLSKPPTPPKELIGWSAQDGIGMDADVSPIYSCRE